MVEVGKYEQAEQLMLCCVHQKVTCFWLRVFCGKVRGNISVLSVLKIGKELLTVLEIWQQLTSTWDVATTILCVYVGSST
jgi:hypothetical protein